MSGVDLVHFKASGFAAGRLGKDSVADQAHRKGTPLREAERGLGPNVAYKAKWGRP